jgi:hypothetical protein
MRRLGLFRKIEMRHLRERVHAGIGAAGAIDRCALAAEFLDRVFDDLLDRHALALALPADERRAVVLERDLVAGHEGGQAFSIASRSRRRWH